MSVFAFRLHRASVVGDGQGPGGSNSCVPPRFGTRTCPAGLDPVGKPKPLQTARRDRETPGPCQWQFNRAQHQGPAPITSARPGASRFELFLHFFGVGLDNAFFDGLPLASTRGPWLFRPRPVMARTSLMTLILLAPASVRNDVEFGLFFFGGSRASGRASSMAGYRQQRASMPYCLSGCFSVRRLPGRSAHDFFGEFADQPF